MKKIFSYKKKLLVYLSGIFLFFTFFIFISLYLHEKNFRSNSLNWELDGYSQLIYTFTEKNALFRNQSFTKLDSLLAYFPNKSLRISLIDLNGKVIYDSHAKELGTLENHFKRPEIQKAIYNDFGTNIRLSHSTNIEYYYYAKRYQEYFIRVSAIYNIDTKRFLEPNKIFLSIIILIFFIAAVSILLVTDKFGKSIITLNEFIEKASANKMIDPDLYFPDNELGKIGKQITLIYSNLNKTKEELLSEKEKLIRHLNMLEEGIGIFSKEKKGIVSNGHFIQYINHISDKLVYSADDFFNIEVFESITGFIDKYIRNGYDNSVAQNPYYEISFNKNGKYFSVKCVIFQDKSFEILITDVTKPAKRKVLKQEITDNIAHELKTPVSSIKGFLETILNNPMEKVKMQEFIQRAYSQTCRLAELINDISLLTKIEEAGSLYSVEKVHLNELVKSVIDDVQMKLKENNISVEFNFNEEIHINGNPVLLYSVFRNLFDNAIHHAGQDITISIDKYSEDSKYYYFSFSDNGSGVPEKHLSRLFERFYRIDKGRDRRSGGTGLGLAIVKNAILFHKGEISVKNKKSGGLEFLFSISRELE